MLLAYNMYWLTPILVTLPHFTHSIGLVSCLCQAYLLELPFRFLLHCLRLYRGFNRDYLVVRLIGAYMDPPVLWYWLVLVLNTPLSYLEVSPQQLLAMSFPVSCWSYDNSWYIVLNFASLFSSWGGAVSGTLLSFSLPIVKPFTYPFLPYHLW